MKVRLHAVYTFRPVALDRLLSQHHDAVDGQRVKVIQLPGAPRPNTIGHAHIADARTGAFLGMVATASLVKE